jgi:polyhydroxybutyrate depolymerase
MDRITVFLLRALIASALGLTASNLLCAQDKWSLYHDGHPRTFLVHVPTSVARQKPTALVFVLHGGGGDGEKIAKLTGFDDEADRQGFIAVFPDGLYKQWNDGRSPGTTRAHEENIDDVGFISAIVDTLRRVYAIDPRRIFATGISNGGIFSHYLAARRSDLFAAIAPVAGGIAVPFDTAFHPTHAVSVLIIQGTEDPLIPYEGGGISGGRRGSVISTDAAVHRWISTDGCEGNPIVRKLPDNDPEDGCMVEESQWDSCSNGTSAVLLRIEGGGHTWPGGAQYLPRFLVGRVCRDLDATKYIWRFFRDHPKPMEKQESGIRK